MSCLAVLTAALQRSMLLARAPPTALFLSPLLATLRAHPPTHALLPVHLFSTSTIMGSDTSRPSAPLPKGKSEDEWRAVLSPAQFKVLREHDTERAFTSDLDNHYKEGVYTCAGCDTPLYKSATKFKVCVKT